MLADQRNDIRSRMRRLRRDVVAADRAAAAANLCARLTACDIFRTARHIAAYFPNDGEINAWHVIRHAWNTAKSVYLPVLQPAKTLGFAAIAADSQLTENRYGIPEPDYAPADLIAPAELDLVLLPLVAFDDSLFRLGMGGGYYDKTFGFVRDSDKMQPMLIGVAYDFQRVETVFPESWDVPVSRVVTDKTIYK